MKPPMTKMLEGALVLLGMSYSGPIFPILLVFYLKNLSKKNWNQNQVIPDGIKVAYRSWLANNVICSTDL